MALSTPAALLFRASNIPMQFYRLFDGLLWISIVQVYNKIGVYLWLSHWLHLSSPHTDVLFKLKRILRGRNDSMVSLNAKQTDVSPATRLCSLPDTQHQSFSHSGSWLIGYLCTICGFASMTILQPSDGLAGDQFGASVSISGNYAVVGAQYDDVGANTEQGSAYIFYNTGVLWGQQAKLVASDGASYDHFGVSVSLSGDYALIGAHDNNIGPNTFQGSSYVFLRAGTIWSEQAALISADGATGDKFGYSVSISGDYLIVGAYEKQIASNPGQGMAYIFLRIGTLWNQQERFSSSDGDDYDRFGYSVSLSGSYALIGAYQDDIGANSDQGSAYVFLRSGTDWNQQAKLTASEVGPYYHFGSSVSLDEDYALIGAKSHDVGTNGSQGAAFVFIRSGVSWSEQALLTASDGESGDYFGTSVSLSGEYAIVGSPYATVENQAGSGNGYLFHRVMTSWSEMHIFQTLNPSNTEQFGASVAVNGNFSIIGAPTFDNDYEDSPGGALLFVYHQSSWEFACPPANALSDSTCAQCELCDVGEFKDWYGTTCDACSSGSYVPAGSLICIECESGKYNELWSQTSCIECSSGKYNPGNGSIVESDCLECEAGRFSPSKGSFSALDCISCPLGRYGVASGLVDDDDCALCDAGKYSSSEASLSCTDCPVDTIQPVLGQSFCSACPFGYCTKSQTGQTSCSDCTNEYTITSVFGCVDFITAGSTYDCPTAGGVELTIMGTNWDFFNVSEATVEIGGIVCDVTVVGSGLVKCILSAGVGLDLEVVVAKSAQGIAGSAVKLSYVKGSIDSVFGCVNSEPLPHPNGTSACSRDGFDEVTVTGNNFGPIQAGVLIGGVESLLVPLSARGWSGYQQSMTIAIMPAGSGLGVGVNVLQRGGRLGAVFRGISYKSCDPGFYNLKNDSGIYDCVECASGHYNLVSESFSCVTCPAGSYCTSSSISSCDLILSGSSSPIGSSDSSSCICPLSFISQNGSCSCDVGFGYDGGLDACVECGIGKYKDVVSKTSCSDCPDIKETAGTRSTAAGSCICPSSFVDDGGVCSCDVGVGYDGGLDACVECAVGKYKDVVSKTSCSDCPEGMDTVDAGSATVSFCVCPTGFGSLNGSCVCAVGFGYDGDSCVVCSKDSVKPDVSLSACFSCKSGDPNSVSNENSTACICGVGFVMAGQECEKCTGGMICNVVGLVITSISLDGGHWRESSTDLSTRECPYEKACTGSSDISNQCLDGHSGPLCAICEDGYTSANSNSACGKCFEGAHAAGFSIVILMLSIMIVTSIILSQVDTKRLKPCFNKVKLLLNDRDIRTRFRILLAYFQIIGSFTSVLSSSLPVNYTTFLTITQMASLNFGSIFAPRCFDPSIDFYDELLVQTIGPILIGIIILLTFIISSIVNPDTREKAKAVFLSRIFLSSFIFFPSASTSIFQIFNCDDDFESGSSYLKADYGLACDGAEYDGYVGYASLMILIYPIGIPLFYFVCLWFQREKINETTEIDGSSPLVKTLLQDSAVISNVNLVDSGNSSMLLQLSKAMSRRVSIERACVNPSTSSYSSLFGAYKPEYWFWECVECVRRLSLTGLLVFMYAGTEKQVLLAMILCMLFMVLYSFTCPYLTQSSLLFMMISQWGILLQLYGIVLVTGAFSSYNPELIGWGLVLVGCTVFIIGLWYIVNRMVGLTSSKGEKEVEL